MAELKSFDRVAHLYDATRGFPAVTEAEIADGLARLLREAGARRLLEVGVGTGRVAVPLAARGVDIVGIDISPRMVRVLRAKGSPVRPLLAEATRQPFRDATFEAAVYVHILHLVPDPAATVAETIRVLRPGALILSCATSHEHTAATTAGEIVREVVREVTAAPMTALRSNARPMDAFRDIIEKRGGTVAEHVLATWPETTTAREQLAELAGKVHSHMWSIPDDRLDEVVRVATPRVVEAMGGLDAPVTSTASFVVYAATLPG